MVKCLLLKNNSIIITVIEEVYTELGEPDCKLINPYLVKVLESEESDQILESWLSNFTKQNEFMIHSDKILTIFEPKPTLLEKYLELTA